MTATSNAASGSDRRRAPRTPLHMNVILLHEDERPRGCRVLDVSESGMFLEWSDARTSDESEETAAEHFKRGDRITILFSFRTSSGRKHLELPSCVMRTEGKGIGIAFDESQSVINELVETYREHRKGKHETHISEGSTTVSESQFIQTPYQDNEIDLVAASFSSDKAKPPNPSEPFAMELEHELADAIDELCRPDTLPDIDDLGDTNTNSLIFDDKDTVDESSVIEERAGELLAAMKIDHNSLVHDISKIRWLIVFIAGIFFATNGYFLYDIQKQLEDQETSISRSVMALGSRIPPPVSIDVLKGEINEIHARLSQLDTSLSPIKEKVLAWNPPAPSNVVAPPMTTNVQTPPVDTKTGGATSLPNETHDEIESIVSGQPPQPEASKETERPNSKALADAIEQSPQAETKASGTGSHHPSGTSADTPQIATKTKGPWVINLLALKHKNAAERFVEKANRIGITVAMEKSDGKTGPLWRLRVTGLETAGAAREYARTIAPKLGLKNTWISKR